MSTLNNSAFAYHSILSDAREKVKILILARNEMLHIISLRMILLASSQSLVT
jgi:hypothetical protein